MTNRPMDKLTKVIAVPNYYTVLVVSLIASSDCEKNPFNVARVTRGFDAKFSDAANTRRQKGHRRRRTVQC